VKPCGISRNRAQVRAPLSDTCDVTKKENEMPKEVNENWIDREIREQKRLAIYFAIVFAIGIPLIMAKDAGLLAFLGL